MKLIQIYDEFSFNEKQLGFIINKIVCKEVFILGRKWWKQGRKRWRWIKKNLIWSSSCRLVNNIKVSSILLQFNYLFMYSVQCTMYMSCHVHICDNGLTQTTSAYWLLIVIIKLEIIYKYITDVQVTGIIYFYKILDSSNWWRINDPS